MSDIFLSYKNEDKSKAQTIAEALKKKGYSVWWDRIIPVGEQFDDFIEKQLNATKCVIVLWSKESVKSKWVRTEASEGNQRGILIPILIEDVQPPLAFRMIEAAKLVDWDGKSDHLEFDLLLESVAGIIGRPPVVGIEIREPVEEKSVKQEGSPNEKTFTNSIGMKFNLIQAGWFMMGSDRSYEEKPVHKVTMSKLFYLGIYPVTQHEWKVVMGNDPSDFKGENLPVEMVSWNDIQEFLKKLNAKEGTNKYRLPTEAEWEYAARAGTTTRFSFGDEESRLGDYAWYDANSGSKTHKVGQKKPNAWGLYDMHGNVWEWVEDKWVDNYEKAPDDGSATESENGSRRVGRGGGWGSNTRLCRSASRYEFEQYNRSNYFGFRVLMQK